VVFAVKNIVTARAPRSGPRALVFRDEDGTTGKCRGSCCRSEKPVRAIGSRGRLLFEAPPVARPVLVLGTYDVSVGRAGTPERRSVREQVLRGG
jgi:hypothetical protein